jgi:hypothetical protein
MEGRKNLPGQGSSEQGEQKVEAVAMEHEEPDFFVTRIFGRFWTQCREDGRFQGAKTRLEGL